MQGIGNLKHLISLTLLGALFVVAYVLLGKIDFFKSSADRANDISAKTAKIDRELLSQVEALDKISLKDNVFKMPSYASLVDLTVHPEAPALSRPNPFTQPL